jgi:hypothetical protein
MFPKTVQMPASVNQIKKEKKENARNPNQAWGWIWAACRRASGVP